MGALEGMMNFWQTMEQYHRTEFFNGEMPYMTKQYTVAGDLVDWMSSIGIGFNTMGNYEYCSTVLQPPTWLPAATRAAQATL